MVNFKGLTAKAKQYAQRNPDKVNKGLDKAGNLVDKRTGRKYERHVNTVQQKARTYLGGGRTAGRQPGAAGYDRVDQPPTGNPAYRPAAGPGDGRIPGTDRPDEGPRVSGR